MACVPMLSVSWKDSTKRQKPPLGFRNLGNSCYLNSVLQCLTYTPPLANFCLQGLHSSECNLCGPDQQCPFCLLEKRIQYHLKTEVAVDEPSKIYRRIQSFAKDFRPGRQEDAHELLRCAIDACNNVCLKLQNKSVAKKMDKDVQGEEPLTVVKEIFGGALQSQIRCLSCNNESNKLDDIMDLSLEVIQAKTLKEALGKFFQSELLEGSNKYSCGNCKKLSTAWKQMFLHQAPNVLVIQFKRFENIFGRKIDRQIGFEEQLQLSPYMSKSSKDLSPDYTLYGVLVHVGPSQFSGHYYAYVKDASGQWYCCDDAHVEVKPVKSVLSEKAYMLFYVRNNLRPKAVAAVARTDDMTPSPPTTPDADVSELSRVKFSVNKSANVPMLLAAKGVTAPKILEKGQLRIEIKYQGTKAALTQCKRPIVGSDGGVLNQASEASVKSNLTTERVCGQLSSIKQDISVQGSRQNFTAFSQPGGENPNLNCSKGAKISCDFQRELQSSGLSDSKSRETASEPLQKDGEAVNAESQNGRIGSFGTGDSGAVMSKTSGSMQRHEPCQNLKTISSNGQVQTPSNGCLKRKHDSVSDGLLSVDGCCDNKDPPAANFVGEDEPGQFFELESLKLFLEKKAREELKRSGWCSTLRDSLRAAKRRRVAVTKEAASSGHGDLREEFIEVKAALNRQVPQSVKEQLIEMLWTFLSCKNS